MKKIGTFLEHLSNRIIAYISMGTFLLSMIPIWYLAKYARPSGDDYDYSILTHAAWTSTHSLFAVGKAALETVEKFYAEWNGNWCTVFLFSFMPEVFVPWSFWIVPFFMTGGNCSNSFLYV